jgi:hypothetical protein
LPITSSIDRTGETISCSSVPRSRSRAMPIAVNITIVIVRITPTSPGTMYTAVRRSGLYQVEVDRLIGSGVPSRHAVTRSSADHAATTDAAVWVALATVCASAPSTTSCTSVGRRAVTAALNPAGITSATLASPRRNARATAG